MIIKRERLELEELLKDKTRMEKLNPLLRQQIYDFCRDSNNLKRKEEKIKRLESTIEKERINMRKISKRLTCEYHFVKNELSLGRQSIYINPEMKGKSFRLDIDYRGTRRKITIGKSLKDLNDLCKKHSTKYYEIITEVNWKKLVKSYLGRYINNKIEPLTKEEFENIGRFIINPNSLEIEFVQKKHETEKTKGKPLKKPSSPDNPNNSNLNKMSSGGILKFGGNSGWNSKVTNIDDTPESIKYSEKEDSEVKKYMGKQKMGGNTRRKNKH